MNSKNLNEFMSKGWSWRSGCAEGNGSGGSGPNVNPDWNQNDPSKPDYVKNRPFYAEDPVETVIVEEQTCTLGDDDDAQLTTGVILEEGRTYTVIVNGQTYELVAWYSEEWACVCLGNGSLVDMEGGDDVPFIIDSHDDRSTYFNVKSGGDYTVKIIDNISKIQADNRYSAYYDNRNIMLYFIGEGSGWWDCIYDEANIPLFYQMSTALPDLEFFLDKSLEYTDHSHNYTCSLGDTYRDVWGDGSVISFHDELVIACYSAGSELSMYHPTLEKRVTIAFPSKGVYCMSSYAQGGEYRALIYGGEYKPVDRNVLPPDVTLAPVIAKQALAEVHSVWSFDIVVMLYPKIGDSNIGIQQAVLLQGDYSKISGKINSKIPIMPLIYKDFAESKDLMYSDTFNACGIRSMMNDDWQICYNTNFNGDVTGDAIMFYCDSCGYCVFLLPDNSIRYYVYD